MRRELHWQIGWGCLKQVGKVSITSTAVRDPDLAVDEVGPIPAQDIIPDEEPNS